MVELFYSTRTTLIDEDGKIAELTCGRLDYGEQTSTQTESPSKQAMTYTCSGTFYVKAHIPHIKPKHWKYIKAYHNKHTKLKAIAPRLNYWKRTRGQLALVRKRALSIFLIII